MRRELRSQRQALEGLLADFEPGVLDGLDAVAVVKELAKIKSVCAAAEARVVRRIEQSNVWRAKGHKSAAHLVASVTGTSVGSATTVMQTAEQLADLPATTKELASGRLSEAKAREIAAAAIEVPEMERTLLLGAPDESFAATRDRARRAKAAGTDQLERHRRAHAARSLRSWTDAEGIWQLHASGTPTDGARIMSRLNAETETVFKEARTAGARESTDAYRFDALVRLAETAGDGRERVRAHVFVNVDAAALTRGHTEPGERCEIKGVGPVPVATARALMGDALLTILVKRGVDVTTVAHDGTKTMPASVRRAVLARDPDCVVDTCAAPTTEIHHVEWRSDGGEHSVHNCRGVCDWCHDLVHYHGYTLEPNGDG
ncbi:MAG: DUF222 domain-containing protein, partial [Acidimicrobiia bacterium]